MCCGISLRVRVALSSIILNINRDFGTFVFYIQENPSSEGIGTLPVSHSYSNGRANTEMPVFYLLAHAIFYHM